MKSNFSHFIDKQGMRCDERNMCTKLMIELGSEVRENSISQVWYAWHVHTQVGFRGTVDPEPQGFGASTLRPRVRKSACNESVRPTLGPSVSAFLQLRIQLTRKCVTLYNLLLKTILSGSNLYFQGSPVHVSQLLVI